MFSDFLFCIFSYNRGYYLENLLLSIKQYYPEVTLAIFDDASDDPKVKSILESVPPGTHIHITDRTNPDCKHGGLYGMMNTAIGYAKNSQFKYAYFVQDDMQFLWRDEKLYEKIESAFNRPECMMCNSSFLQKILVKGIDKRLPLVEEGLFSFAGNGVADTGIIDISKARQAGLHFYRQSESGNGAYWHQKGYRLYWLAQPNLAWLPWPEAYRFKKASKGRVHSVRQLTETDMQRLRLNTGYTYLEDYARIDAFLLKPYWQGAHPGWFTLLKIYIKYYLGVRLIKRGKE